MVNVHSLADEVRIIENGTPSTLFWRGALQLLGKFTAN